MGRAARSAVLLAAVILFLLFANLVVNIGLNRWQRWFFDTLERRDTAFLPLALTAIAALVLIGAGLAVAMVTCRMTLQVNWRRWLTEALMAIWLDRNRLGAQGITGENHGSPAFRVAEDVRLAIDPIVDLVIGFLNASILAITFVGILVIVGGSFPLVIGGTSMAVPAYIAIAALVHAAAVSGITLLVGRPLMRRVAQKNEAEAQFMFELTRYAEGGRMLVGAAASSDPQREMTAAFHRTIGRWRAVIHEHARLTWIINSNSFLSPAVPLLLAAPKYVAGDLSLGAVMQIAAAYVIVLGAFELAVGQLHPVGGMVGVGAARR